ncbi:MAG: DEAD/DEAH box helicase family protein, partial [Selenomonadaceae bacterium]|nr:DEAD/DEAH box helicase family protein [Selenomonadaceae bacterium]
MKFEEAFRYKLIYIFSIPDDLHRGYLKIGDTTLKTNRRADFFQPNCNALKAAAKARINEYTQTAAVPFKLEHTELAVAGDIPFRDYHVHCLLKKYRRKIKDCKGREWFKVDLNTAIKAIAEVKQKLSASIKIPGEIVLRSEQEEAITRTVKYFKNGNEFLWNAKMRFGKTLCALEVVKRMNFAKTIIITHRPVVNEGWYEDFQKIFGGNKKFDFGSKFKGKSFNNLKASKKNFVYFASIQDLRGSQIVNEKSGNAKNFEIFNEEWDFVIIDEAHEGTTTDLGKKLRETLVKGNTKLLELSGTPFNIIERYGDNVFTWDYVMEQKAKADWDKNNFGDSNPYEELPQMNIYTYDLGKVFDYVDAEDKSFSFSEFFRTSRGRFVHERDVEKFLDMLGRGSNNNYPFSRTDFREMLKHTLWIIPGVKEGKALSELLKNHPAYCVFEIVNVAGDGDSDDEPGNALEKVRDAIDNYEYTITLSCGKLTAGVTVPEWTAVFYLAGS